MNVKENFHEEGKLIKQVISVTMTTIRIMP